MVVKKSETNSWNFRKSQLSAFFRAAMARSLGGVCIGNVFWLINKNDGKGANVFDIINNAYFQKDVSLIF